MFEILSNNLIDIDSSQNVERHAWYYLKLQKIRGFSIFLIFEVQSERIDTIGLAKLRFVCLVCIGQMLPVTHNSSFT